MIPSAAVAALPATQNVALTLNHHFHHSHHNKLPAATTYDWGSTIKEAFPQTRGLKSLLMHTGALYV